MDWFMISIANTNIHIHIHVPPSTIACKKTVEACHEFYEFLNLSKKKTTLADASHDSVFIVNNHQKSVNLSHIICYKDFAELFGILFFRLNFCLGLCQNSLIILIIWWMWFSGGEKTKFLKKMDVNFCIHKTVASYGYDGATFSHRLLLV